VYIEVVKDDPAVVNEERRREEFVELCSPCQRKLYAYIVTLLANDQEADDVLQNTNFVLWQKFDQFRQGTSFIAWARETARYEVLRFRRLRIRDVPTMEPSVIDMLAGRFANCDEQANTSLTATLPECVEKLSDADRELIDLRYASGIAVKALAERLHRSVNAVSLSLGRIRRRLRKCMEETVREQTAKKRKGPQR